MRRENPEPPRSRIPSPPQEDTAFAPGQSFPATGQSRGHFPGTLPTAETHEASSPCHSQFPEFSFLPMTQRHSGRASTIIRYLVPEFEKRTMDSRTSRYLGGLSAAVRTLRESAPPLCPWIQFLLLSPELVGVDWFWLSIWSPLYFPSQSNSAKQTITSLFLELGGLAGWA